MKKSSEIIRVRVPGLLPLELWDLCVPGSGIIWEHRAARDFSVRLREVITQVWEGRALTRSEGRVPDQVAGFRSLYLAGGGAVEVREVMSAGPWGETCVAHDPVFGALAGGLDLLQERGLSGWVLDVGQSGLKLAAGGGARLRQARDWQALPLREDVREVDVPGQRGALRRSIAALLVEMHELNGSWPESLVVGLPCRLDDDGLPEGSSYIGMAGDRDLLPEAARMAGLPEVPLLVLNDAELAAVSARVERVDLNAPTLVLTIGFGVGGALLLPR